MLRNLRDPGPINAADDVIPILFSLGPPSAWHLRFFSRFFSLSLVEICFLAALSSNPLFFSLANVLFDLFPSLFFPATHAHASHPPYLR